MAGATCGSCLKGLDVVERAARGLNLRDRRSTLETGHRFRGRRSIFCIWVCVCVAGAAFGSCLKGLGLNLGDRRSTLEISWQAQYFLHLGVCLAGATCGSWMLSSVRLGGSVCVGDGAKISWQAHFFCIWVCVCVAATCGSCLKGLDVVERAARGLNLRDRRRTLETGHRFRGRRSFFCIWVCVCVAGATYDSCLEGLDIVERAARKLNLRDRHSTFTLTHSHLLAYLLLTGVLTTHALVLSSTVFQRLRITFAAGIRISSDEGPTILILVATKCGSTAPDTHRRTRAPAHTDARARAHDNAH